MNKRLAGLKVPKSGVLSKAQSRMLFNALQATARKKQAPIKPPSKRVQARAIASFRSEVAVINRTAKTRITPADLRIIFSDKPAPHDVVSGIAKKFPKKLRPMLHSEYHRFLYTKPNFETLVQYFVALEKWVAAKPKNR